METQDKKKLSPSILKRDHVRGSFDAPLTLVQYGDYACSYCTEAHPIVRQLQSELEDDLRFVYRHFPVASPNRSRRVAEAAEAAGAQDAFWAMHDLLSAESGTDLTEMRLFELAEALELDVEAFRHTLSEHNHAGRVEEDLESARESGVRGTPTFFVNGERYDKELSPHAVAESLERTRPRQSVIAQAYLTRLGDIMGRAGTF